MFSKSQLTTIVVLLGLVAPRSVRATPAEQSKIADEYKAKYSTITTIRMDYESRVEPVVSEESLFREKHMIIVRSPVKVSVIYHRDGRLFFRYADPSHALTAPLIMGLTPAFPLLRKDPNVIYREVPYERVRERLNEIGLNPPDAHARLLVYDGHSLMDHTESHTLTDGDLARQAFLVINTARLQTSYIPPTLLDRLCITFMIPHLANEFAARQDNRLSDVPLEANTRLLPAAQQVDGARCIVLEQAGKQRFYLDPTLADAVRKREWLNDGSLSIDIIGSDFRQVGEGLWLPAEVLETQYGYQTFANGAFNGKPIFRRRYRVEQIRLNDPADLAMLKVDVPVGSVVVDQTLGPVDKNGAPVKVEYQTRDVIPSVAYVEPADKATLDRVIHDAQRAAALEGGAPLEPAQSGARWRWLVALNCILLVIVIAAAFYRYRKPGTHQ